MQKPAIFCLFASFLFCYLELPPDTYFVYELVYMLLFQTEDKADAFMHPLVLLPSLGQLMILVTLFQKQPKKWMVLTGMGLMGILVLMLVVVGVFGKNWKISLATVPFIASAVWCLKGFKRKKEAVG